VDRVPRWGLCNSNYLGDGPTRSIGLPGALRALRASGPDAAQRSACGTSIVPEPGSACETQSSQARRATARQLNVVVQQITLRPVPADDWVVVHEWASTEVACRYQPRGPNTVEGTKNFVSEAVAESKPAGQVRLDCGRWCHRRRLGELQVRNRGWRQSELPTPYTPNVGVRELRLLSATRCWTSHLATRAASGRCDPRNGAAACAD
jgi:ribosomal-protein-alanine N-acetyltransferase